MPETFFIQPIFINLSGLSRSAFSLGPHCTNPDFISNINCQRAAETRCGCYSVTHDLPREKQIVVNSKTPALMLQMLVYFD